MLINCGSLNDEAYCMFPNSAKLKLVITGSCSDGSNRKPVDYIEIVYADREYTSNSSDITTPHRSIVTIRGL